MSKQFTKVPTTFENTSERYGTTVTDAAPYPITITYYNCTDAELDDIAYECWCYEKECEWKSDTKWPKSAISLMEEDNELSN